MAEDGKMSADVDCTDANGDILSNVIDVNILKDLDTNYDQNDSRATNPDGAQSPASSTYADCEETDTLIIENQADILVTKTDSKENLTNTIPEIVVKQDEIDNLTSSIAGLKTEIDENSQPKQSKPKESVQNGYVDESKLDEKNRVLRETTQCEVNKFNDSVIDLDCTSEDEIYEENEAFENDDHSHSSEQDHAGDGRENGDGEEINEEEVAQKKLDDDEDRRNPQYIPKRGFFYEHDDRTAGTGSEDEAVGQKEPAVSEAEAKKKGRRAVPDGRWQHDMYKEDEQYAKSTQELIDIYGYDIRNEESAPKARRRRKYGRGPNRYTRKWDDEDAYGKEPVKSFRPTGHHKSLPVKREEYEAEFPAMADHKPRHERLSEHKKTGPSLKHPSNQESFRSDSETKYREDRRRSSPQQKTKVEYSERPPRNFSKRAAGPRDYNSERSEPLETKSNAKPLRTKFIVNTTTTGVRGRGRGIGHGQTPRYVNNNESEPRSAQETKLQFTVANRGRAKRLDRVSQQSYSGRSVTDQDIRDLSEQVANTDLRPTRSFLSRVEADRNKDANDQLHEQTSAVVTSSALRSKRYSQQRHRLLPESNNDKNAVGVTVHSMANLQSIPHNVKNMLEKNDEGVLCQSTGAPHTAVSLITQNQLTTLPPQNVTPSLSMNTSSIPSNSLAVSASLIPLSTPSMTATGAALQATAPPLPIMGFFQHPQGFANQGTAAQLYSRDQNVIGGPSNQPVQLVAFLPATSMMSNTTRTQAAPPPPPPPPPATYPTSVISYPQASPSQQTQPTFNSETYSMPPVTLAPIHPPPDVYQSRGGVTYYNTRSQVNPRLLPPPRVKAAIPIVPPPNEAK